MAAKTGEILQLKVTLAEVKPPVWRRLLVPADMTLAKLHDALQAAMGWTNSHLHCFEIAGRRIGMVGVEEDSPELEDERRVRVASVLPNKGAKLLYRYDYGDDWEHIVEVEEVTARDRRLAYPYASPALARVLPRTAGAPSATRISSRRSRTRNTTSMTRWSPGSAGTSTRARSTRTR